MRISSSLLLLLLLIFVFAPSIQEWIIQGGTAWYRPFIVWSAVILFIFISQRGGSQDEL